jgi:hypothetical protein
MTLHHALAPIVFYAFGLLLMTALAAPAARSMIRVEAGQLGNLFLTNETTQILLTCDGNEIRWTLTDYFGAIMEMGTQYRRIDTSSFKLFKHGPLFRFNTDRID